MAGLLTDTVLLAALLFILGCLALGLTLVVATIYFEVLSWLSRRHARKRKGFLP